MSIAVKTDTGWQVLGGGGNSPTVMFKMAVVDNFSFVGGPAGITVKTQGVKLLDGSSATLYTLLGDDGFITRSVAPGTLDDQGFELPEEMAEPTQSPATFSFECTTPGILYGAMLASGGAGGASQWASSGSPIYQPQGAPGGAGGLIISHSTMPNIFLPYDGQYTVTVGGRTPANAGYGIRSGQNTTIIHDATGYVVTAVGGGGGGSAASNSGYGFAAGNGGSAGSPILDYALSTDTQAARMMRGRWVPGQGHDAGRTEGYAPPGAGGAGSPGYDGGSMGTAVGGDGVDLRDALGLDPADSGVSLWASAWTDPDNAGWVAGGGTGRKGTTGSPVNVSVRSIGGGGMSKAVIVDRDAYAYTGSGGGAGNSSMIGGSGAGGAVHIVVPT